MGNSISFYLLTNNKKISKNIVKAERLTSVVDKTANQYILT
jgi:hypothetical protein